MFNSKEKRRQNRAKPYTNSYTTAGCLQPTFNPSLRESFMLKLYSQLGRKILCIKFFRPSTVSWKPPKLINQRAPQRTQNFVLHPYLARPWQVTWLVRFKPRKVFAVLLESWDTFGSSKRAQEME